MSRNHIVVHRPETPTNRRHPDDERRGAGEKAVSLRGLQVRVEHAPPPESAPHVSHGTVRQFLAASVNINKVAIATPVAVSAPQAVIASAVRSAALHQAADPHMQGRALEEHIRLLARAQVLKFSRSKVRTQLLGGKRKASSKDKAASKQYLLACSDEDEDDDGFIARITPSGGTDSSDDGSGSAPHTPDEWMERVLHALKDDDPRDLAELLQHVTQEDPYKLKAELSLIVNPLLSSDDNRKNTPKLMAWLRGEQKLPRLSDVRGQVRDEAIADLERLSETPEGMRALRELNTTETVAEAAATTSVKPSEFLDTYKEFTETDQPEKPRSFCEMLKLAIERFGMDGLSEGMRLLMKAFSQDLLISPMPSVQMRVTDKTHLEVLMRDLGSVKLNNTFIASLKREIPRIEKALKTYAAGAAAAAA